MSWWTKARNQLFELRTRHRGLFATGLVLSGASMGLALGLGAELLFLGGVLGWMGWELRPRVYLALGMFEKSAKVARQLAIEAGPSYRGDLLRLTEAAAWLNLGELAAAKASLKHVEVERLTGQSRLVYYLNQSTLFARLGDGETSLVMVEAATSEADDLDTPWKMFPELNRSLALFELGRYEDAVECLEQIPLENLAPRTKAYVLNNLAWATVLGQGDAEVALAYAVEANKLRKSDPYCRGTLGFCLALVEGPSKRALGHLAVSLEQGIGRSPSGKALLQAASAQVLRGLGKRKQAALLEAELLGVPGADRHLVPFRNALLQAGQPQLMQLPSHLPEATGKASDHESTV